LVKRSDLRDYLISFAVLFVLGIAALASALLPTYVAIVAVCKFLAGRG